MSWERALEADARLAAKNSVLIRAALRQSVNWEAAYRGYQATTPDTTLSLPQQRTRARAWAIINIRVNLEAFKEILYRTWAQAYALGDLAAQEQVDLAREAQKEAKAGIDWSKWKPGDAASAIILKPPKAFQRLLERQGIVFKGFSDTTLTDLGNAIGEAIELGLDAKTAAKRIMNHVASPARALTIAITEQNRAMSEATKERYLANGLRKMTWLVFDPCKICAQNANVQVIINQPFPSNHTQPPAHPNCRCALSPVIAGYNDQDLVPGATAIEPPPTVPMVSTTPVVSVKDEIDAALEQTRERAQGKNTFVPGKWKELSKNQIKERTIEKLLANYPGHSRESLEKILEGNSPYFRNDKALIEKGAMYINGPIEVQFHSGGASVPKTRQKEIVAWVDKLQTSNPKTDVTVIIGPSKRGAYGWATLGGDRIWLAPKTAKTGTPNLTEGGSYKMPSLRDNPQWKYTLSHEWGHHIDEGSSFFGQTTERENAIMRFKQQFKDVEGVFISGYAKEKSAEFLAEMFAEWYLTGGKTTNPLIQAMAKEFGWTI